MSLLPSGYDPCSFPVGAPYNGSGFSLRLQGLRRRAPKHPDYSDAEARYRTFTNWPHANTQDPFALSMAGFFHTGVEDCTRCFHCGVGLKNWLPPDIPFVEHARWAPDCEFIRQRQGDDFVDSVGDNFPREYTQVDYGQTETDTARDYNEIVQRVLERPSGISIKEMFSASIAAAAVTKVLSLHGWEESDVTIEELANVAIELADNIDNLSSSQESTDSAAATSENCSQPAQSSGTERDSLLAENRRLKDQMNCKVCHSKSVSAVVLPCGHFVTCSDCATSLSVCVLCHQAVATSIKVYV